MNKCKRIGLAALLLLSITIKGFSQTVTIFFVAPTATINASYPGIGSTVGMPAGYSFVPLTAATEAPFLAMPLPQLKYVYGLLHVGTPLYNLRDKVFNNSDRMVDVEYYLTDDRTAFAGATGSLYARTDVNDNKKYIWPAAMGDGPYANGRYRGWIGLGEHQLSTDAATLRPGLQKAVDEVVLHETSHTQWIGDVSKWPTTPSGLLISYGADGGHSVIELLGDQETPLNEGLATFYGFTQNPQGITDLYQSYTIAGQRFFVEGRSVLAGDATLNAVPSRTRFVPKDAHNHDLTYPDGLPLVLFSFPWRDIPGWYLMFAETTSTTFYTLLWDNAYANKDTTFSFIGYSAEAMHNGRMQRYLTYSVNRIALKMEEYNASPAGQADASKTSSLLPFAILDLVTHFGMSDADYKADYDRHYPDRQPRAYTEYWTRRAALRALVQPDLAASPIGFAAAMAKIKNFCQQPANMF